MSETQTSKIAQAPVFSPPSIESSVLEWFYYWEQEKPEHVYLRQPYESEWKEISYRETGQIARRMVSAMRAMGLQKGDHISILSKNCYHWMLADLAIQMGGFVSVPLYYSLPKEAMASVLEQGDVKGIFLGKLDTWGDKAQTLSPEMKVIRFPHYEGNARVEEGESWDDLIEKHDPMPDTYIPSMDETWRIIFTSGTTGTPKGAVFVYRSPTQYLVSFEGLAEYQIAKPGQTYFSYLPLNHIAEAMGCGVSAMYNGGTISFAESLDTFAHNLRSAEPGLFIGVPRIWSKFHLGVLNTISQKKLNLFLKIPFLSNYIKRKVRKALGLSKADITLTGAAIAPAHLKKWYKDLGINLWEGYGCTEVLGGVFFGNDPHTPLESVGKTIPGVEAKIDPETGEIMVKTDFHFQGYYKDPQKTSEVLSSDGWYRTGDRGRIDERGFLYVTGRVKDAFKTAKGKFIVPNPLEEIISDNELVEQVCVAGLTAPQPMALVNLSEIGATKSKEEVESSLEACLAMVNKDLNNYTKLSKVVILSPWTIENELITPTLKVRRGKMDDRYHEKYPEWYQKKETIVWEME